MRHRFLPATAGGPTGLAESESARHSRVRQYWAAVAVLVAEHQAEPRKLQCLWLFFELSRGCAEIVAPSRSWFGVSPGVLSCGAGPRAVHQLAVPNAAELLLLIGEEYHRAGMPDREIIARQESCAILRELADRDPRNRDLHRHLSIHLSQLAKAEFEMGDLGGALARQEKSLLISRKLRKAGSSRSEQITDAETLAAVADLQFELQRMILHSRLIRSCSHWSAIWLHQIRRTRVGTGTFLVP